ncbi:MAG: Crp/Fnr family transcriptional regulator, partial [Halofilum sp. (in: g-proteobacteria)]|nr:Crp/Fnr family transcriptional regulator [Halofilum sp. (in: g-proteobacteria)]
MHAILSHALGDGVNESTLQRLGQGLVASHHRANEVIYRQGSSPDGIYFIGHGCVLLEWTAPNGFVAAFRLASTGEGFGYRSFCGEEPRSTVARSVTSSLTLHVPARALESAMTEDPGLIRALARLLARDVGPKISKIARNGRTPVRTRLAYVLTDLVQRL